MKINRRWKLLNAHHKYCARLFYCLAQLMHMVINLLDLLAIFQAKSCNGNWPPRKTVKSYLSHDHSTKRKWFILIIIIIIIYIVQSFTFSTVAIDMHGKWSLHKALSIEYGLCASPYLQLQCQDNTDTEVSDCIRLYF